MVYEGISVFEHPIYNCREIYKRAFIIRSQSDVTCLEIHTEASGLNVKK